MGWLTPSFFVQAFMSWLLPFLFSFVFFDEQGEMRIRLSVFHVIMSVTHNIIGAHILQRTLRKLTPISGPVLGIAMQAGAFLVFVNCFFDIIILIPFINVMNASKPDFKTLTIPDWFATIGAGYAFFLSQAWLAGSVADMYDKRGAEKASAAKEE